jgi:DNA-binding NtrC family response regulator
VLVPEVSEQALVVIDRRKGVLVSASKAAMELLGLEQGSCEGLKLQRALPVDRQTQVALEHALTSQAPVTIPPFTFGADPSNERLCAAVVIPPTDTKGHAALLLWPVSSDAIAAFDPAPAVGDTLAVLGVDRIRLVSQAPENGSAQLMHALRKSLNEVVRANDAVSAVIGTAVVILLRDIDIGGARDICRALLSHLHLSVKQEASGNFQARLRIGLARLNSERSAQATFLAAERAMLQSRVSWESQQVRAEDAQDFLYLVTDAVLRNTTYRSAHSQAPAQVDQSVGGGVSVPVVVQPIDTDVAGYVVDNMEGAVDQAMFLGRLDMPVSIVGPAGTGKMYVARVLHDASAATDMVPIDCRELKGRKQAEARISRELARGEGKTLVFKSPHLLHADAQIKLARQISSRTLADAKPPRALANMRFVALFPHELHVLMLRSELTEALASVFAGFPIHVPPIRDRKQAVLRWAHKILFQESAAMDRPMRGFTADAEQAMLVYDWPGNISEMRQCIRAALSKTKKNWLTPVDLGLFDGIDPEGSHYVPQSQPFLAGNAAPGAIADSLNPSTLESLDVALGQAVRAVLQLDALKPLGTWLDDDLVQATLDRYRGDVPRTGKFLHTKPRNVSRWLPKVESREADRANSALWQTPRRLLREWVREASPMDESPMEMLQNKLLVHLENQASGLSTAKRAVILGVSTPTYLKRLKLKSGADEQQV